MSRYRIHPDKAVLIAGFAKIHKTGLAMAFGSLAATLLFAATAFLVIKGPGPNGEIGPHLGLLGIYLPFYTVTWAGAVIGAVYAFLIGGFIGFVLAVSWNLSHYIYITLVVIRASWWRMMGD